MTELELKLKETEARNIELFKQGVELTKENANMRDRLEELGSLEELIEDGSLKDLKGESAEYTAPQIEKVLDYINHSEDSELWRYSSFAQKHDEIINYLIGEERIHLSPRNTEYLKISF
jgi:predicted nuclease with TOPRIM domain